jgi:hypothetical protein
LKRSRRQGSRSRPPQIQLSPAAYFTTLAIIVFAGALVRFAAAQGELWLDEIWSYRLAHLAAGPLAVLTSLHNDNNHYLNTLYLRSIPDGTASWWLYRLPALVLGSASVVLAALIARARSQTASLAAALVTAGFFLLVVYSSEARGYALAVFFAFAAVFAVQRYLESRGIAWGLLASACACLGLLGHLTFLHALAGLAALVVWRRGWSERGRMLVDLAVLFLAPVAILGFLYWTDLRHLQLGGGPLTSAGEIAANALALGVGGPETGGWKVVATLAAFVAAIASIAAVHRSGSDLWILFLVTGLLAPALTLAVVDTGVIYERYLLVALAFITLSFAWLVERLAYRSRLIGAGLVVLFVLANGVRIWEFVREGRSHYLPAITRILAESPGGPVTLGSDHDFRNGRVLDFYGPFVRGGERIRYEMQGEWSPGGPEWLLTHRIEPAFAPRQEITVLGRYQYRLVQAYPYPGISGWHLALYRNAR